MTDSEELEPDLEDIADWLEDGESELEDSQDELPVEEPRIGQAEEQREAGEATDGYSPGTPVSRSRAGRNGPRSSGQSSGGRPSPSRSAGRSSAGRPSPDGALSRGRESRGGQGDGDTSSHDRDARRSGGDSSTSQSQKRPRGNLPTAPTFDGDRKRDPRCFKKYANKVDSYVAIAEKIIDQGEIGLRLHAALEGEAADFLEDVPAKVFGEPDGWKVLLKVLRDKYDEPPMNKVGTAMKNFFQLQIAGDKTLNMRDIAEHLDRAARQCREAGLEIPDAVMIHFYFQHSGASTERQANLLLRTNGQYDWKKLKTAVEVLYPNVVVRNPGGGSAGKGGHRSRGAHEVQHTSDQWMADWSMPDLQDQQVTWSDWIYDNDVVEALAEQTVREAYNDVWLPDGLAQELTTCFNTHRENRQKLAKAVQARGYYVKGKGKGRGKKGGDKGKAKGKGKSKSSGKARGMSLDELKAKTACAECGQTGHWKDECPRRSNVTGHEPAEDEEAWDYDGQEWPADEWDADAWDRWEASFGVDARSSNVTARPMPPTAAQTMPPPLQRLQKKAFDVFTPKEKNHGATSSSPPSTSKQIYDVQKTNIEDDVGDKINVQDKKETLFSDDFVDRHGTLGKVRKILTTTKPTSSSEGDALHAVRSLRSELPRRDFEDVGSVWSLLRDGSSGPNVDSLRKANVVRNAMRSIMSMRRQPTVTEGKYYLTIDTACENTVVGSHYVDGYLDHLKSFNLMPLQHPEREQYCFGPGDPKTSTTRLSIPVGIAQTPAIIKTSLIQEEEGAANRTPFLAGQDWLLMMGAVIDLGNNVMKLPKIDKEVPLFVDYSGHLVIEIDNYPPGGWPAGLTTSVDEYPGAIFTVSTKSDMQPASPPHKRTKGSAPFGFCVDTPNYTYEPNDDTFNQKSKTSPPRGPCTVETDYWEFLTNLGIVIRHHRRPRCGFYQPTELDGGPQPQTLQPERLTKVNGGPDIWDMWTSRAECPEHLTCWTGQTCFFLKGFEKHFIQNSHKIPTSAVSIGVGAKFLDEKGESFFREVDPQSLTPLQNHKKIIQYDIGSDNVPIFEHAEPRKRLQFEIPAEQFGSRAHDLGEVTNEIYTKPQSSKTQPAGQTAGMGSHGHAPRHHDDGGAKVSQPQQGDPRDEAPGSSSYGVHGGPYFGSGPNDPRDVATFDDQSSGTDSQDLAAAVPRGSGDVPPRRGVGKKVGQCQGEIHGVHSMRTGQEGTRPELHGAHLEGDCARLRDHPRSSRSPRRKSSTTFSKPTGIVGQLGRMLLALLTLSIFSAEPTTCTTDYSQLFEEEFKDITERWLPDGLPQHEPVGLGTGGHGGGRRDALKLKQGIKKRLKHSARRALQTSKAAREIVAQRAASSSWPKKHFHYDLIEVFGGSSMISIRAVKAWGLKVLQPIDIRYGIDLRARQARRWLRRQLEKWRPRLTVIEFPCTVWSILQSNTNKPEDLAEQRERDRPFLQLVKDLFKDQRRRGGHALAENPATAASWVQDEILELRQEFFETTSCMCQFGMIGKDGMPMLKRVRWLATHEIFIEYLDRQCNFEHTHEKVAGSNTSLSAQYPPDLADTIIRAYLAVVRREDFGVHHDWQVLEARHVNYIDVKRDEEQWRPLLAQAQEVLARRVQNSCFLDITSDLYQKILPLVPWQIMNVQISVLPKAKRVRPGLERCHRCSVLLQNDDKLLIETEHLPSAQAPRERFVTPVKVGIFVLGYAPGDPQDPIPARVEQRVQSVPEGEVVSDPLEESLDEAMGQQGLARREHASGECWFIGPPLRHEHRRLAPSLVRMHRNLGHPRNEDFVRALSQHGKVDPEAVALARRLRCASCERTKRPLPPRPASLKIIGGFNEKVCMYFVFLHDALEEKHTYLHILDPADGYNIFIWIPSRSPKVVLDAFTTAWASWAGFPRTAWLDRDGGFEADFSEGLYFKQAPTSTPLRLKHTGKQARSRATTRPFGM